jgi:hypothetical protein
MFFLFQGFKWWRRVQLSLIAALSQQLASALRFVVVLIVGGAMH